MLIALPTNKISNRSESVHGLPGVVGGYGDGGEGKDTFGQWNHISYLGAGDTSII